MDAVLVASLVFACAFGGVLVGLWLQNALPGHHLTSESKDLIGLAMGMIATMTALILGLMTASTKSAFDAKDAAVKHVAVSVLALDRMLADFGPETKDIRAGVRAALTERVVITWPEYGIAPEPADPRLGELPAEHLASSIANLKPQNAAQSWFQSQALGLAGDLLETRFTVFGSSGSSVLTPFLVVLIFWLTMIFGSFGLRAPRNATAMVVLVVAALSVAASVFLIIEMDSPFIGMMKVSGEPLRFTLEHLGK